jgi:hypothetical protein
MLDATVHAYLPSNDLREEAQGAASIVMSVQHAKEVLGLQQHVPLLARVVPSVIHSTEQARPCYW